jgi:hypothetical protein
MGRGAYGMQGDPVTRNFGALRNKASLSLIEFN